MFTTLTPENVTLPKEKTYFLILAIISGLVWLACLITLITLPFILLGLAVGWFAHGILIAQIRSEAVKVGPNQLPDLANTFALVCADLGLKKQPELYVLQAGGMLNAFATRFAARDFVVLYSDTVEAYGEASGEIRFLLGHEIGHVRSKHILKYMFVTPGSFLPLLGSAYSRACESSCDRHGAYASHDEAASVRAMMVLSGGKDVGKTMNPESFSHQYRAERGFFVSLHELFSSYPTLSRRVSNLVDLQEKRETAPSKRNPFAYLIALFCPGARYGVFGMIMVIYLVGICAGVAVPSFVKARERGLKIQREAAESAALEEETASPPDTSSEEGTSPVSADASATP